MFPPLARISGILAVLAVVLALAATAEAQVQIDEQSLVCTRNSLMLGDVPIPTCNYSNQEYLDSITFYASAVCLEPCVLPSPISTSFSLNIGLQNGPCNYIVQYNFRGAFYNPTNINQSPYVFVQLSASSRLAWGEGRASTDCDGMRTKTGASQLAC